jgi:hypothetical protein
MPELKIDLNGMTLLEVIKAYPEIVEAEIKKFGKKNYKENLKSTLDLVMTYRNQTYGNTSESPLKGLIHWLMDEIERSEEECTKK